MSKNSAAEIGRRRLRIRQLQRLRATPEQIIMQLRSEKFKISRATLTRDFEALRDEDRQWIDSQAQGEFITEFRLVIESLQEQVRQVQLIRSQANKPYDKIQATLAIKELELDIHALLQQGPTYAMLRRRLQRKDETARTEEAVMTS